MDNWARNDRVAALLGKQTSGSLEDAELLRLCELVPLIVAFVRADVRGNGFTDDNPTEELEAVISSAAHLGDADGCAVAVEDARPGGQQD
jgi:hypothetical protein